MILAQHPLDTERAADACTIVRQQSIDGLTVVLVDVGGSYAVCSYLPDGTRRGGSCHITSDHGAAQAFFEEYVRSWCDPELRPTAREVIARWRAAKEQAA